MSNDENGQSFYTPEINLNTGESVNLITDPDIARQIAYTEKNFSPQLAAFEESKLKTEYDESKLRTEAENENNERERDEREKNNLEITNLLLETYPNAFDRQELSDGTVVAAFKVEQFTDEEGYIKVLGQGYVEEATPIMRNREEVKSLRDENLLFFSKDGLVMIDNGKGNMRMAEGNKDVDLDKLFEFVRRSPVSERVDGAIGTFNIASGRRNTEVFYRENGLFDFGGLDSEAFGIYFNIADKMNAHYEEQNRLRMEKEKSLTTKKELLTKWKR